MIIERTPNGNSFFQEDPRIQVHLQLPRFYPEKDPEHS